MRRPLVFAVAQSLFVGSGVAQVEWTVLGTAGAPAAHCASAFDAARNRLVAFGGQLPSQTLVASTSEWDGIAWQVRPGAGPSARARAAMAYDPARGQCLLFGGNVTGGGFSNQTWTYDGTNWALRSPATVPPARYGSAMAFDSARRVVVMFAGFVPGGQDSADLWEWDGANWTQRTWVGPAPSPRGAHRMAYDAARGQTVLYGGYRTPQQTTLADAWAWNGTAWTQLPAGPGSLCDQAFAYDSHRRRVVLFGGLRWNLGLPTDLGQTWEWDGASWLQRVPVAAPSVRSGTANGFDATRGRVLVAGGTTFGAALLTNTLGLQPTRPATAKDLAPGCDSSAGPIALPAISLPYIGSVCTLRIVGGPSSSPFGLVAVGKSNQQWDAILLPLDLGHIGAPGCPLQVGLDTQNIVPLVNGSGELALPVPPAPTLVGSDFYAQAAVVDPLSPRALQIALSPGRRLVIGSP